MRNSRGQQISLVSYLVCMEGTMTYSWFGWKPYLETPTSWCELHDTSLLLLVHAWDAV